MTGSDPIAAVNAFLAFWADGMEAINTGIDTWFKADTIWENVGMATTTGPEQAKAFMAAFQAQVPLVAMKVDMLCIAASGNSVLTERIDRMIGADGSELAALRVMGVFEFDADGKLKAWRDYFDTAPFKG